MLKKKRVWLPILIIILSIVLMVVLSSMRTPPEQVSAERQAVLVEVQEVQPENVQFSVNSQGEVKPKFATELVTEVSGKVTKIAEQFVAGGVFAEGDMLIQLDPSDYQAALQQARADLLQAQSNLAEERARAQVAKEEWAAIESGEIPDLGLRKPQLASAAAALESAEARLAKAKRDLERTTIRAPFAGILRSKAVDIGQFLGVGSSVAVLYGTDVAEIRLPLGDRDLAYIDMPKMNVDSDQQPLVQLQSEVAGKAVQWQARLVRSEGVLDSSSRVIYGVAEVQDPYHLNNPESDTPALRFGHFVQAEVGGKMANGVFRLPRYALTGSGQVWVVGDERALELRDVQLARREGNTIYIEKGLQAGDKVVLTQLANPLPGMKVRLPGDPVPDTGADKDDEADSSALTAAKE